MLDLGHLPHATEREWWRKLRSYPGYQVSNLGRVRSVDRVLSDGRTAGGVILSQWPDTKGYLRVKVAGRSLKVHLLVLEAFHGRRPAGMVGCHGPGGKNDNRAAALRWDTPSANELDKRVTRARTAERPGASPAVPR